MKPFTIRKATIQDASSILAIYIPYIKNTAFTFEYEIPSIASFEERMIETLNQYPYLIAELEEEIIAYAYASSFHARAAYQYCAEVSVYTQNDKRSLGAGKALYAVLERILKQQNVLNLNACITYPNEASIRFHKKNGFIENAHFHKCGYKLDQWWDMIWMEKMIGDHNENPKPFIPFSELSEEDINEIIN